MSELSQHEVNGLFAAIITKALGSVRIPLTNEKEAQACISAVLERFDITHEREYRLSPSDIPDFWLPGDDGKGAVLEVKMNGARAADVYRQLQRYARDPRVGAIFLVTNRAMGLPAQIEGKDAYYISLGQAWL